MTDLHIDYKVKPYLGRDSIASFAEHNLTNSNVTRKLVICHSLTTNYKVISEVGRDSVLC